MYLTYKQNGDNNAHYDFKNSSSVTINAERQHVLVQKYILSKMEIVPIITSNICSMSQY